MHLVPFAPETQPSNMTVSLTLHARRSEWYHTPGGTTPNVAYFPIRCRRRSQGTTGRAVPGHLPPAPEDNLRRREFPADAEESQLVLQHDSQLVRGRGRHAIRPNYWGLTSGYPLWW